MLTLFRPIDTSIDRIQFVRQELYLSFLLQNNRGGRHSASISDRGSHFLIFGKLVFKSSRSLLMNSIAHTSMTPNEIPPIPNFDPYRYSAPNGPDGQGGQDTILVVDYWFAEQTLINEIHRGHLANWSTSSKVDTYDLGNHR